MRIGKVLIWLLMFIYLVDHLGKRFRTLYPTSPIVREKVKDWRLDNALKLVTSTSSIHSGRQVIIKSIFEIVNQTSQSLILALNPDPRHTPNSGAKDVLSTSGHNHKRRKGKPMKTTPGGAESVSLLSFLDQRSYASNSTTTAKEWNEYPVLELNQTHQVPLNLLENALHLDGKQLGSIWLAPQMNQYAAHVLQFINPNLTSADLSETNVGFTNVPIQLAKIVHQTSAMFDKAQGDPCDVNLNSTGMQIACPIVTGDGTSVPYCFVVSINRSPVVGTMDDRNKQQSKSPSYDLLDSDGDVQSSDNMHQLSLNQDSVMEEARTFGVSMENDSKEEYQKKQAMKKLLLV